MHVKTIEMILIVDDNYDTYGTIEELSTCTDVIQRYSYLSEYPEKIKLIFYLCYFGVHKFICDLSPYK